MLCKMTRDLRKAGNEMYLVVKVRTVYHIRLAAELARCYLSV